MELQCLIDATVAFCLAIGLPISFVKTVVMVFACDVPVTHVWNCGGHTLSMVDSYKYLGIMLQSSLGVLNACSSLYSRMCHAWAVIRRKYAGLRCAVSVRLLLEVYMVCVPPGSYACELWALRRLPREQKDDRDNLASYHIHVLRAISGIRKSIPRIMLYLELQQAPLDHSWWVRVIQFWNNLTARPDSCIYKLVASLIAEQHLVVYRIGLGL